MINEHDRIVLRTDVSGEGLCAGDVGTVVYVYADRAACEVGFVTLDGRTAAVVTLEVDQVRPVEPWETPHARQLQTS